MLYTQMGDIKNAEFMFENVLEMDPNNIHAHNSLGTLFRRENRLKAATEHFRKAVQLDPTLFRPAIIWEGRCSLQVKNKPLFFIFRKLREKGLGARAIERSLW